MSSRPIPNTSEAYIDILEEVLRTLAHTGREPPDFFLGLLDRVMHRITDYRAVPPARTLGEVICHVLGPDLGERAIDAALWSVDWEAEGEEIS